MTTLLLDADIIAFKIASVSQKTVQFDPEDEPCVHADDWEDVVPRIHSAIDALKEYLRTDDVIVCLSCPTAENFRLDVLPSYKGKRDYSKRPVHLGPIKDYMEANWPSYRRPRLEADDIMGILSTSKGGIIVSEDKDMQTIPGLLFNPAKDTKARRITVSEADRFHLYQTLVGDTVDCYSGCPGIGPVKAEWWLSSPELGASWEAVEAAYWSKGLTEEDALIQARVARILRASDFNFNEKRPLLWTPDSAPKCGAKTA